MIESAFKILNSDGSVAEKEFWNIRNFESYDIPIIYLNGSIAGMTKDNKVTLGYIWKELSGTCTLKWQGNSSIIRFQKRNYTINFDNAFEVVEGWGKHDKYCFKSNFNDPSYCRNILCATLWGKIVKTRTTANTNLNSLVNGGAVDGFPVIISLNGKFHGLYTWNIPKDAWLFGMNDTNKQQAIVCADISGDGTCFKTLANFTNDFELEYSSDDSSDWVLTSVNRLISAVMESDGTNITYGITPYIDWDSAIDYYIHTVLTKGTDAIKKNYIMVTFDGVKWAFSAYDMDTVFGVADYGASFTTANGNPSFVSVASEHALFGLIWKYMRPQLRSRYKEIREAVFNEIQVSYLAYKFTSKIPLPVSLADMLKHNRITASGASNIEQILTYLRLRLAVVDEWIESTDGETTLPEQVDPETPTIYSITNNLTNCTTSNNATSLEENNAYGATIKANNGYEIGSATVTMGGVDITSSAYSNGEITIGAVTGDVVITITATEVVTETYTNLVPTSIDTDGSIYNSIGYKNGYRVRSGGAEGTATNNVCTGFIPAHAGDTIRVYSPKSSVFDFANVQSCMNVYDSSKTNLGQIGSNGVYDLFASHSNWTTDLVSNQMLTYTIPTDAGFENVEYIRLTVGFGVAGHVTGEGLVVTVNQEIE